MNRLIALKLGSVLMLLTVLAWTPRLHGQSQADPPPEFFAQEPALREYVGEALARNPSIREAEARHRSTLQRVPQVTTLPDPVFGFTQALRTVETRVGSQLNTFSLSQAFPWFGKLDLRGAVAAQEAAASYQLHLARQREVIAQVKAAFYNLAFLDEAIRISEEEQSLLVHYEQLAQIRYSTGQGLQQAVVKTQAEITRVMDRLQVLGQQRESFVARLNTLMDRPPQSPVPATDRLRLPDVTLDLEALYELGDRNRQELQAARELIQRSERSVELARKNYWPDVVVGASFTNMGGRPDVGATQAPGDEGKNALSVSVGLNIPLWRDKYDAGVREAAEGLVQQQQNLTSLRNEMELSIRDQVVRLQTLREQANLFEQVLIPQAEEALKSTEAAYQTGQLNVLDLLDSERMLLEIRLGHERHYADYLVTLANLERAVGTAFPAD